MFYKFHRFPVLPLLILALTATGSNIDPLLAELDLAIRCNWKQIVLSHK